MTDDPDADRRAKLSRLNERIPAAYAEGAEEQSRRAFGRGLTAEELDGVLRRFPGLGR